MSMRCTLLPVLHKACYMSSSHNMTLVGFAVKCVSEKTERAVGAVGGGSAVLISAHGGNIRAGQLSLISPAPLSPHD